MKGDKGLLNSCCVPGTWHAFPHITVRTITEVGVMNSTAETWKLSLRYKASYPSCVRQKMATRTF